MNYLDLPLEHRKAVTLRVIKWQKAHPEQHKRNQKNFRDNLKRKGLWKCSAGLTREQWRMYRMFLRLSERENI